MRFCGMSVSSESWASRVLHAAVLMGVRMAPGGDAVHADAARGHLLREAFHQQHEATL